MEGLLDGFHLNDCILYFHQKTSLEHFVQGNKQLDSKCLLKGFPSTYARV